MEGKSVPNVTFKILTANGLEPITTDDLFKGKKVAVFSLPGAFTPTCSAKHLPRFNALAHIFKQKGFDDIICFSVNDPFVMKEWGKDQEAENVRLIPDGNGEFSQGMGQLVDKADLCFGKRSWRYSMIVKDKIVEKMFIEPNKPGDPYEVSDADTMLHYVDPNLKIPGVYTLITRAGCPHCRRAVELLEKKGLRYETVQLDRKFTSESLFAMSGNHTTPQIFHEGKVIGGADELAKLLA
eukprot:GCRY01000122.1.p2 GENE.GCRY01000122.1~~GCRY01000122.1.p2  ORF type:complete len:239 (+),score=56.20 GCRY01000122.1:246-962(+)